ncbi:hypothetical protein GCM10010912_33610 [Paenibacillus albidus]|uniref:Copper amine oxidase-like N-terminal domain-containing protein n=1 Tax=Paenibacillus albidus TaxID=2041023 RepID=A0A917CDS1_9BACL|nr:hypothetical protein [Paenibacillus albidus]GGF85584.1 hypothetical protein GCM10010912_33610 [Paenibacillus albidus]
MKKKTIVAASIAGMLATGSAGVYAGSNLQQIKAYLNHGIGVQVNGADYTMVDGNGKKLTPITYEGLTYLPTRSVANALKVPVTFDAANNKVVIGSSSGASSNPSPGTGKAPADSGARSKYLPADFPIPKDAVVTEVVDGVDEGKKQVLLIYLTKDSIDSVGKLYTQYVDSKNIQEGTKVVEDGSLVITGKLGNSVVSIIGSPSGSKPGYNEITITWAEE